MKKQCVLASMILVVFFATTCWAGTATDDMGVGVTVVTTCNVTANDLTFPDYDGSTDTYGDTTLDLNCSTNLPVTINLTAGTNYLSETRTFDASNSTALQYNLYTDDTYSVVWGAIYINGGQSVSYTGTGGADSVTVYGKIPAGQSVAAGSHAATVTAELSW